MAYQEQVQPIFTFKQLCDNLSKNEVKYKDKK